MFGELTGDELEGHEGSCDRCGVEELVFENFTRHLCAGCLSLELGVDFVVGEDGLARPVDEEDEDEPAVDG